MARPIVLGAAIDRVCRWLGKDHFHRIEATTCWQMTFAAMRAARATNLGPILRLRAYPGHLPDMIGGQPDPRAFLGSVDVVVADGAHARY